MSKMLTISFLILSSSVVFATSENCPEGKYRRKAHSRSEYYRADGTFYRAAKISEACISKGPGYDFWISRLKNERPLNWPQKESSAKWTEEQRERVLEALSELPESLWSSSIKGIYRLSKSEYHPNPASHSPGIIILYDTAFGKDRRLARILAHELAHESYEHLTYEEGRSYRLSTGWTSREDNRKVYWIPRPEKFVREDGSLKPGEDYSNNLEYFLFEPEILKKTTPKAFDWMKRKFGDKFKLKGNL